MTLPLSRQVANQIDQLEELTSPEDASEVQQAMDEADLLFREMKSIGETLTAAYKEIVGLQGKP